MKRNFIFFILSFLLAATSVNGQGNLTSNRGELGLKTFQENGEGYNDLVEADIHIVDEETGEHVYSGRYSYYYSHHFELERNKRYIVNMRLLNDLVFTTYQYFSQVQRIEDKIAVIHFDTFSEEYVALAVTVREERANSTRNTLSIDNEMTIESSDDVQSINVYNLSGVKVNAIGNQEQGVNLNNLAKGTYVIETTMKNGNVETRKISVK